jgi:hypothetical protein
MPAERAVFIPLMTLSTEWTAVSGLPLPMVLRHVCGWTVAGAFPVGALLNPLGKEVTPLSVYKDFLKLEDEYCPQYEREDAFNRLKGISVTSEHVRAFCETTGTHPPPSLLSGIKRAWVVFRHERHLAPPPCPEATKRAAKLDAGEIATGWMNNLASKLAGLQGKGDMYSPRRAPGEPLDAEFWETEWAKTRSCALEAIQESEDPMLRERLDQLDADWKAFVTKESAVSPAPVEAALKPVVRLRIHARECRANFDDRDLDIPPQPFKLLFLLAQRAKQGQALVSTNEIEDHLWGDSVADVSRTVRDVVRDLRAHTKNSGLEIENRPTLGYAILVTAAEIEIID